MWIFLFKHHGLPPKKGSRYQYFFVYSLCVGLDLLLSAMLCLHVFSPLSNFYVLGIPYLLVLPGMTLFGPFLGMIGAFAGSSNCLMFQSSFNRSAVLVNYPLTLIAMLFYSDDSFYVSILVLLLLNKIAISYSGGKVRQHWLNPDFSKNYKKIKDRFRNLA